MIPGGLEWGLWSPQTLSAHKWKWWNSEFIQHNNVWIDSAFQFRLQDIIGLIISTTVIGFVTVFFPFLFYYNILQHVSHSRHGILLWYERQPLSYHKAALNLSTSLSLTCILGSSIFVMLLAPQYFLSNDGGLCVTVFILRLNFSKFLKADGCPGFHSEISA